MSTSGTTISELTRADIIDAALRKVGVTGEGVSASSTQTSEAALALNQIVAEFQTLGMALWKRTTAAITMVADTASYTIGVSQTINTAFPLRIYKAVYEETSGSQRDMEVKPWYDFDDLPTDSEGPPIAIKYQPKVNLGVLTVWPTPTDTEVTNGGVVTITYQKPFDVFTATGETPDFPQEWGNALIYQLALVLSDEYGLPIQDKQWLEKQAEKHLATALSAGQEEGSIFFQPARR